MKIERAEETGDFVTETCFPVSFERTQKQHWHTNFEIIHAKEGHLRLAIAKRSYDLNKGDFAVLKSCDYHAYMSDSCEQTVLECIRFSPKYISRIAKLIPNASFIARLSDIRSADLEKPVGNALDGIMNGIYDESPVSEALKTAYIVQLCLMLMKTYHKKEDTGTTLMAEYEYLFPDYRCNYDTGGVDNKTMSKFQSVLEFLNANFTDSSMSLSVLSQMCGLSKCYISELFPAIIGVNFKQYLYVLRIDHALRLLSMSDVKIADAAFECGFDTIRTFNNVFKKLKGVTPSEFLSGMSNNGSSSVLLSGFKDLCAADESLMKYVYGGSCGIVPYDDPLSPGNKVFGMITKEKNKVWTTFNVNMVFRAGGRYEVSFDLYCLPDVNGKEYTDNNIGVNFYYADSPQKAPSAHSSECFRFSTDGKWHHYSCTRTVSKDYVPGLYDKFSVFGNPANDVGINFLLDHVSCVLI